MRATEGKSGNALKGVMAALLLGSAAVLLQPAPTVAQDVGGIIGSMMGGAMMGGGGYHGRYYSGGRSRHRHASRSESRRERRHRHESEPEEEARTPPPTPAAATTASSEGSAKVPLSAPNRAPAKSSSDEPVLTPSR